jgi:hypothetical protein
MPQFNVDEDLAALIERLAEPKPFEHLSFNNALWRVVNKFTQVAVTNPGIDLDGLLAESMALMKVHKEPKKLPSPSAKEWAASVPDLKSKPGLNNWRAICDFLKIETGGDSARRRLRNWVKDSRPNWPPVPEVMGD